MLPVSTDVRAVPLNSTIATVVNVPAATTRMRFVCGQDVWLLTGQELAEVPTRGNNNGDASALLQANVSHEREVYPTQRLSFIVAGDPVLASLEFFP